MWVAVVLAFASLFASSECHGIRTRFINQPVDHFNFLNPRNYDQRYLQNSEFFQAGGPIYIHISAGERYYGVYDDFIKSGLIYELAADTNGMLFSLEHRYFGQSRPTPDTSFPNLQFLTIHQALADIARFIDFIKRNTEGVEDSRVILWGSGYAGSLAVWARQKYPNLVDGAWGSSARINAVVNFPEILVNAFTTVNNIGGTECGDTIFDAFGILDAAFVEGNTTFIMERLRLCEELDGGNLYDLARLDYTIAETSYRFIQTVRYPEVDEKCRIMTGADTPDDPPIDALDGFARWYIDDLHPRRECFDYRNDPIVESFSDPTWDSVSTVDGRRQFLWLQCTQLGWFPITNEGQNHPYGSRFEGRFFRSWCADAFNNENFLEPWFMEDLIERTNRYFGGLNPNTHRIIITQGEMDPARTLSPLADLNSQARVIVINLESFSRDMGSPSDVQDLPHLLEVKEIIREEILAFISDADRNQPSPYSAGNNRQSEPVPY